MVGRVLIVLDGAPDSAGTLAAARTPALDALCRRGAVSLLRTTPPGLAPGSETGIPTLLGAPPAEQPGRGWIEAAAAGIEVPAGSIPWRIDLRRMDGRRVEAAPLREAIAARLPQHDVFALRGHRLLAVGPERPRLGAAPGSRPVGVRRPRSSGASRTEELRPAGAQRPRSSGASGSRAADPARPERPRTVPLPPVEVSIWPDGAVLLPVLDTDTVMICGTGAAAGCARLLGLDVLVPAGATGDVDTDLAAKAAAAEEALAGGRDVVIHVGALDEAAHRCDSVAKRAELERIDVQLVTPLSHHTIAVTADHSTCPHTGRHGAEPVPLVVAGPGVEPSGPDRLAEAVELVDDLWSALRVEAAA